MAFGKRETWHDCFYDTVALASMRCGLPSGFDISLNVALLSSCLRAEELHKLEKEGCWEVDTENPTPKLPRIPRAARQCTNS